MALEPGTIVAGYRIERVLGAGGMGTVYLARHPALPRNDALKVLSSELSQDPEFRTRFTREADLAAGLDHPNVVTVYNRGETEAGQLWIAMQYVPGTDADAELRAGNMPAPRAVHIVTEVAKALDYAHSRNLLHRDVKPANFLLSPGAAGEPERVLLADFGIARARDDASGLTNTGAVMATIAYASPEAIDGRDVDGRSDVYSLGCALHRLLTGKAPFWQSNGMTAVMMAHLTQPPPRVTENAPWLPPAMNDVVAKAMAKDPAARYQSGRELALAATAALRGESVSSTGPTRPVAGWQGAHPPPPNLASVPTPPAQYVGYPPTTPPPFNPVAPQRRSRKRWIAAALASVLVLVGASVTAVWLVGGPSEPAYTTQTFTHAHGATTLTARPQTVAAVGPGDAATLLSLGVQPAAIVATGGQLPSWEQEMVTGAPPVLAALDLAQLSAVQPDLILATGVLDDATYASLQDIAPTITRPKDTDQWLWSDQVSWIGEIMGYSDKAEQLINDTNNALDATRSQYPAFNGKTVSIVTASDASIVADLRESNPTAYAERLGYLYNGELTRQPGQDSTMWLANTYLLKGQVLIVGRTDVNAADGGYGGLPGGLSLVDSTIVIIDDPDAIAALQIGGPAAFAYLNANVVPEMANVVG